MNVRGACWTNRCETITSIDGSVASFLDVCLYFFEISKFPTTTIARHGDICRENGLAGWTQRYQRSWEGQGSFNPMFISDNIPHNPESINSFSIFPIISAVKLANLIIALEFGTLILPPSILIRKHDWDIWFEVCVTAGKSFPIRDALHFIMENREGIGWTGRF